MGHFTISIIPSRIYFYSTYQIIMCVQLRHTNKHIAMHLLYCKNITLCFSLFHLLFLNIVSLMLVFFLSGM